MRLLLAAAFASVAVSPAAAMPLHQFSDLAISPAGDRVAAVESDEQPNSSTRPPEHVVVRDARTGIVVQTIPGCAGCRYSGLSFAPDGRLLAVVNDKGTTRLLLAGKTLASFEGIAQDPSFAPDGKSIAVLATFNARKQSGATQAGVRQVGEIGEANDEQRIAIVPLSGGTLRPVTPADRYVYEYDWMPDGRGFVMTSAPGNGDNNWWVATLDRIDLASGALTRIAAPKMQLNFPRVSPDGRTVAFIGGLMSDFGAVGGDIYSVPLAGGTPVKLDPYFKGTFTSLLWDRNGLAASSLVGDRMAIVAVRPAARQQRIVGSAGFDLGWGRPFRALERRKDLCDRSPGFRTCAGDLHAPGPTRSSTPTARAFTRSRTRTTAGDQSCMHAASPGKVKASPSRAGCSRRSSRRPAKAR